MPASGLRHRAGSSPQSELDALVLVAGDAEADLGALAGVLTDASVTASVASGIPAACAALRLAEYAVVVADVATPDDALVLLRAAGRGRPAARVVCLFPADYEERPDLQGYIEGASFAVRRHPLPGRDLHALVRAAQHDFAAERGSAPARTHRDQWKDAEQRLAASLASLLQESTGHEAGPETQEVIARAVAAASRAARGGEDGPALLLAVAQAIAAPTPSQGDGSVQAPRRRGEAA